MNYKKIILIILMIISIGASIYFAFFNYIMEFLVLAVGSFVALLVGYFTLPFEKEENSSKQEISNKINDNENLTISNLNISSSETGDINVGNKIENHYHSNIKSKNLTNQDYKDYLNSFKVYLEKQFINTISRKLSKNVTDSLEFSFRIANEKDKDEKLDSYIDLLNLDKSAVILSEPGGGKTYLLSMLAKDMIENPLVKNSKIPILLKAKDWSRAYDSVSYGIKEELKPVMDIDIDQIEQELRKGRYLLLFDGLDEVTKSPDLLIDEIRKLSEIGDIQIIITCRKGNYHQQFYPFFDEFVIEKLDDKQIREYVEKELDQSGWNFLYSIEGSLKNLLYTPLFLFMTVSILKNTKDRKLPKNKADLYSKFIIHLMEERQYEKGSSNSLSIDISTKEEILSDFARRTFRKVSEKSDFANSVNLYLNRETIEIVKKELLKTGLLIEEKGSLNFFHPSFHEYFTAFYISNSTDEELISFIEENSNNDSYFEVFIFLAGLLRYNNRQNILLDYLEKNNLYIYRKCLDARFDFSSQITEEWSEEYTVKYFEQVRQSYLKLINNHFKSLKNYFYPWILINNAEKKEYDIIIEGSMDFNTPAINFTFLEIEKNSNKPRIIVKKHEGTLKVYDTSGNELSPVISMSSRNSWYLNLAYGELGIDSAREVALRSIKEQFNNILDEQLINELEPFEMNVMLIENVLSKLPKNFWITNENESFRPSLYNHSVDEIIAVLIERNFLGYIEDLENYNNLKNNALCMFLSLYRLEEMEIDPMEYLLPNRDIDPYELQKDSYYGWELWSDKQLCNRMSHFFESYQISYRYLVENYFSSIKNNLPFYSIGPLRFNIYINKVEDPFDMDFGPTAGITWEPVDNIADIKTIVNLGSKKYRFHDQDHDQREKDISLKLSKLGRKRLSFSSLRSGAIFSYLNNEDFRKEVYKQLKDDLEYIIGK